MLIETIYTPWKLARAVNQTSTSAVAKLATLTEPTGDANSATGASILEIGRPAAFTQNSLMVLPFGIGSDDTTFSIDVWGWAPGVLANSASQYTWFPTLLCEVSCTLSSTNVVPAGGYIGSTNVFIDTIAAVYGDPALISPAADGYPAAFSVGLGGFQKIELSFFTGSSATSANALVRYL